MLLTAEEGRVKNLMESTASAESPSPLPAAAAGVEPPSADDGGWRLEHSYARLPDSLFVRQRPEAVVAPRMVVTNRALADRLGLHASALEGEAAAAVFSGNRLPPGADPIAQAYAGHQYGHFTRLGDGRAILLGEQISPDGKRWDIQLKGSGRTPFSRGGDGRAALGPMLREFLISEAMHALGIPTTRSLAVAATGEEVHRGEPLPGAVLVRVAASHIRVGTFEWAAAQAGPAVLGSLTRYTLARHFPELRDEPAPGLALLRGIIDRQAALIARWQAVAFVHGVMNTDNMAISGETIDYGPCAFMEAYDPATVFSSIDRHGRYAYGNQPAIPQWNLARLAEALLPEVDPNPQVALDLAAAAVHAFPEIFREFWLREMTAKLGLFEVEAGDETLVNDLLGWMRDNHADFTNTFASLTRLGIPSAEPPDSLPDSLHPWIERWRQRLTRQPYALEAVRTRMRAHNPAIIPRNHLVESTLAQASTHGTLAPFHTLVAALAKPFDYDVRTPELESPAPPETPPYRTFCGT